MTDIASDTITSTTFIGLASSDPNDPNVEHVFQRIAQSTYSDSTYRHRLTSLRRDDLQQQNEECLAFEAVNQCKYLENYIDLITIFSIGLLAEIQQESSSNNTTTTADVCTTLASAICYAASQRILLEATNDDPEFNLETGYISRDSLWLLHEISNVIRNEFSSRRSGTTDDGSRAMSPNSHLSSAGGEHVLDSEMERLLNILLDVSEGGGGGANHSSLCDRTPFIYPTALSLCVLLSTTSTFSPTVAMEYRENASSIMSRRLFAGKHSLMTQQPSLSTTTTTSTPRSTASPIEVQLCSPVLAIMTQQSFDKCMARPLQFKLLSERTSTVETTLAMILSLLDSSSWHTKMNLPSPSCIDLVKHYDAPTNIASAAVRTLSLSETSRLGEDFILSLMRYATLQQNGRTMYQSACSLVKCLRETLEKALMDFEREHDNHDEMLYEHLFLALQGIGQIFAETTSASNDMLGQIRIKEERELAADVIRAIESISNNPEVPLTDDTHEIAEQALDEWEVVYKRRDGMDDSMFATSPSVVESAAAVAAAAAPSSSPSRVGAVAVVSSSSDRNNDPQARKMAAFGASSALQEQEQQEPSSSLSSSRPGVSHVTNNVTDDPQARKMAAFGGTSDTTSSAISSFNQNTTKAVTESDPRPESALNRTVEEHNNNNESLLDRARAKIAKEEQEALLNKEEAEKQLYGNDLTTSNGTKLFTSSAAAEQARPGPPGGDKKFHFGGGGSEDHSLPPAEFYGEGLIDGGKVNGDADGGLTSGMEEGGLAVAVPINEAEEEKFITAAEEFNPNDRVPIWKQPKFIFGLATCFLVVVIVAIVVSVVVSKKVVEQSELPQLTQRDTMGFWEQFESVSGSSAVRQQGSPQNLASQYIINVDGRELSPDDPLLIQRYVIALMFTAYNGWKWKWCGGVQNDSTCKYPCWNTDLDCATSKCTLYDDANAESSEFAGECTASRYLEETHECDWYGVECEENENGDRVVTELYLKSNNLNGTFVSEIGLLTSLKHLSLQDNYVKGNMSESIGNLRELETLFLHANQMKGELPESFYHLNKTLSDLDISANQFSGSLSQKWGQFTNLDGFKIFNNTFEGPLPQKLYDMTNVQVMNIRGNNFTGSISEDIGKLTKLREFNLQYNRFTGSLPKRIGTLKFLADFQINNNEFKGSLPEELYQSISLNNLYLHNNFFTGTLSENIGNLKLLEKVVLNNNEFSGPLPQALGNLPKLDTLWVHFNQFEGPMPETVCSRRLTMDEPSSLYADCFGTDAAVSCGGSCCTHCCHNEIFYCFAT